ncbi:MAG: 30S ribosomal protein S6e [Candidatus Woesearchaeota archaeon]
MVDFKLVLSEPKTGLTMQREVKDPASQRFIGLKIGDTIKGEIIGLGGYEFQITGGSDFCGFPMRKDLSGVGRKRILAVEGVGVKKIAKGTKQRKTVCGNTIHAKISQINAKMTKEGAEKIFVQKPKEEKKEEAAQPAPLPVAAHKAEAAKEEHKVHEKKEEAAEKKEEHKVHEGKEEPKKEEHKAHEKKEEIPAHHEKKAQNS